MFTKSMIIAAAFALNANALKLQAGLKAGALAGVNIKALSKVELQALKDETKSEFVEYEQTFSKSYITEEENEARQEEWLNARAQADTHNSNPDSSSQSGDNKFSDMTEQEKSEVAGTGESSDEIINQADNTEDVDLDDTSSLSHTSQTTCYRRREFQWGDDVISPIKDQMQCGSCWSFGAISVLEGGYAIKYGQQYSFSEQKMVDCKNEQYLMRGCNGGSQTGALLWAKENTVPQDTHYPYVGNDDGLCHDVSADETQHVQATRVFTISNKTATYVKYYLCKGPLAAVISTPQNLFSYVSGVMNRTDCPPDRTETLHSVNLIGWTTIDGVEAVIMRNSWGTGWGMDGYAYLELSDNGDDGVCGMYRELTGADIL